jgi:signal transduction histidine kinase
VDDALAGLRRLLDRMAGPDIDLVVEWEDGLPPARFEISVFRRILIDLVQTAGAAMTDRGRIVVRAEAADDRVLLIVADTGPGVAVDELPRVFEPFHEAPRRGAGEAGLAAVYELVVSNGADIRVASTPGGGARFSIYLPT